MTLITPSLVTASPLSDCDTLYAARADLFQANHCYGLLLSDAGLAPDQQKIILERSFITLTSIVNQFPKQDAEKQAIALALDLLGNAPAAYLQTADFSYWNAVWLTFNAKVLDRGSLLPRHIFALLSTIQSNLRLAITLDPTLHVYGPSRVLGTMHTQMPGIAGGDKALAERLLLDAYTNAPAYSANQLAYARILNINGKTELAISVLLKFLSLNDAELNPYTSEPLRFPAFETNQDRSDAKALLEKIGS